MSFRSYLPETYSEPCIVPKIEIFAKKKVNSYQPWSIFVKGSFLDVWQGLKYASDYSSDYFTISSDWASKLTSALKSLSSSKNESCKKQTFYRATFQLDYF